MKAASMQRRVILIHGLDGVQDCLGHYHLFINNFVECAKAAYQFENIFEREHSDRYPPGIRKPFAEFFQLTRYLPINDPDLLRALEAVPQLLTDILILMRDFESAGLPSYLLEDIGTPAICERCGVDPFEDFKRELDETHMYIDPEAVTDDENFWVEDDVCRKCWEKRPW